MTRWQMFCDGTKEAHRLGLDKWENWTPLYYHLATLYLLTGFFIGVFCASIITVLVIIKV